MYPRFFSVCNAIWKSGLYLDLDKINYVDIMEVITGIFYLGCVVTLDNKPISLKKLTHGFEILFNFKFSDIYKKEEAVIERKTNKLTGFLDRLKTTIIKRSKEKGYNT